MSVDSILNYDRGFFVEVYIHGMVWYGMKINHFNIFMGMGR